MCLLGFSSTVHESGLFDLICPSCQLCDADCAVIEGAVGNVQKDVVHVKNKQLWCSRILYCRGAPNAVVGLGRAIVPDGLPFMHSHVMPCYLTGVHCNSCLFPIDGCY